MIKDIWQDRVFNIINTILLCIVLVITLYPLIFVVSASVSDPTYVNNGELWLLPKGINFLGYERVFQNSEIWRGYANTIFYTVVGTLMSMIITVPAAYALSRKDLVGRKIVMYFFMVTMFFSGGLIPAYLLIKDLGMLNTIWAILIPGCLSVYNIIVVRTYFQTTIPQELEDAAKIDGCSNTMLFLKVILPLSTPIIVVMILFYGVGRWNEYFNSMIYLNDRNLYPLQLILREILIGMDMSVISQSGVVSSEQAQIMAEQAKIAEVIKYAVIIVSSLPVILIYPFLQKYFIKGIMVGSVKG